MSLRERPPPSIFQNTGFGNGKICWTTPGLKLEPNFPPPPPPPQENILDQRMIMHQSFLSMPPPPKKKNNKQTKKTYGDGWGWSSQGAGQLDFVCPCSAGVLTLGPLSQQYCSFFCVLIKDGTRVGLSPSACLHKVGLIPGSEK